MRSFTTEANDGHKYEIEERVVHEHKRGSHGLAWIEAGPKYTCEGMEVRPVPGVPGAFDIVTADGLIRVHEIGRAP